MFNLITQITILLGLLFLYNSPVLAYSFLDNNLQLSLETRKNVWPEWNLPGPFNPSGLKRDIVYPAWFDGMWIVESIDLNNPENTPIKYQVKFKINNLDQVVGERAFNALSIGKAVFADELLSVKDDPKSPNRQLARFANQVFLETKIIGRNQSSVINSEFFVDELSLQIFHNSNVSRVNQIETLSKYQLCKSPKTIVADLSEERICGEQWQAFYLAPGESMEVKPLKTSHYKLILRQVFN